MNPKNILIDRTPTYAINKCVSHSIRNSHKDYSPTPDNSQLKTNFNKENNMPLKRDESGRLHIESPLMGESLMRKGLLAETETDAIFRPLPDLNVIKIGGQSVMDRGREVLLPVLDEVIAAAAGARATPTPSPWIWG